MNRTMAFIIFFTIVLAIYMAINYYIYIRGLQAIPAGSAFRPWYQWGFWIIVGLYVAGRILEKIYISYASDILVWAGSFWLAAMLYFLLLVIMFDLFRLVFHLIPYVSEWIPVEAARTKQLAFTISIILVAGLVIGGFINARNPRIKTLEITIDKSGGSHQNLHAVVMSDIHLGTMIGNAFLTRVVNKVTALSPDIILLPGGILDEDLQPVLRQNTGKLLQQLQAPLGVYAIMGNHEHIGGAANAFKYLSTHGMQILRDTVLLIDDSFYLIGREDRDQSRFSGEERVSLSSLVGQVDGNLPIIVMDHQPFELGKAALLGVDLQLSGHTHHGQLWPLNYITSAMFAISRGYGKIGQMHAYVSNGVGTWGPPVRIGNRPEIVSLKIHFREPAASL